MERGLLFISLVTIQLKYKNMKRIKNAAKYSLYILLSTVVLAGCGGGTTINGSMDQYKTVVIEDCEYMYNVVVGIKGLVHKGNCTNSIHDCR